MKKIFGTLPRAGQPCQQPIRAAGVRVRLHGVVEGEEVFHAVLIGVRRLAKALVELAAPATGDQGYEAVKDQALALVLVQAQIQEVAQEPAALRAAKAIGVLDLPGTRIALLRRRRSARRRRCRAWLTAPDRSRARRRWCRPPGRLCRAETPRPDTHEVASGTTRSPSRRANDHCWRGIVWAGASSWSCTVSTASWSCRSVAGCGRCRRSDEELHLDGGIGLKGHGDLPGDGLARQRRGPPGPGCG